MQWNLMIKRKYIRRYKMHNHTVCNIPTKKQTLMFFLQLVICQTTVDTWLSFSREWPCCIASCFCPPDALAIISVPTQTCTGCTYVATLCAMISKHKSNDNPQWYCILTIINSSMCNYGNHIFIPPVHMLPYCMVRK